MHRIWIFNFMLFLVTGFGVSCTRQIAIDDIDSQPPVTEADREFAGVFKPLDGGWEGRFTVLADARSQRAGRPQPEPLTTDMMDSLSLSTTLAIDVRQVYTSESPVFQRVSITDIYRGKDGTARVVESRGVNKIQDGKIWCVVRKPDETVIHAGTLVDRGTLLWRRHIERPLKVEYFQEAVSDSLYQILGWGYYGEDDIMQSPRTWFKGMYHRVE